MSKVLYLDDEKPNLLLFGITFKNQLDIITVDDVDEALAILSSNDEIGYVISDMKMPKMDGLQFIKQAQLKRPDIDYYILSGFNESEDISQALALGTIKAFFTKPFNKSRILSIFEN